MTLPIVHVITSPSFINFVASVFEEVALGGNAIAAVNVSARELSVPNTARVESFTSAGPDLARLQELILESRVAIFHNVSPGIAKVLAHAPPSVLRVWSGWGGDYYGSTFDSNARLLGPRTRRLVNSTVRPTFWAGRAVHALRYQPKLQAAARSTDVFSAPVPTDLHVFQNRFAGFGGRYSQLNYVSVEDSIASGGDRAVGPDILVGNSAAPANNHVEVFELLARSNLTGRRVFVPLSYGNPFYAALVRRAGHELLGDRFVPITEFLPLKEYNELLAQCGIVMMGSQRQMALGNILRAVWQGAHVALDPRNPIFEYLRDRGATVMLLDDIAANGLPTEAVSAACVEINRAFLDEYWSRRVAIHNARALIDLV
ncbi:MAG: TDP-N-acetylfucosamine:lipid II N-acetylfucosaminyltransferase [Cryobacterium sp.]|nr:TDP-N-acetylfucosamine:lipid II N-acetylfucosaminyltransferase [Cryobacterium sp.]